MLWFACIAFLMISVYYIFKEHASAFVSLGWKSASSLGFLFVGSCCLVETADVEYGRWMMVGLVLGALGDVLLALPFCYPKWKDHFFLGGLSAFLLGHLAYAKALYAMTDTLGILAVIVSVLLAFAVIALLERHQVAFQSMRLPSTLYAAVILFMEMCALGHLWDGPMYGGILNIAALCFVLSDLVLAFILFGNQNTIKMTRWNLSLYYMAQFLLALTMLLR